MMKYLIIVLISSMLVSCDSDFKQDPLENEPDRVKKGTPPDYRKPDSRKPCSLDSLLLEVKPEVAVFEEGLPGEMNIAGRVLGCGKNYEIEVLNLPIGSSYDKKSNTFNYTPPVHSVMGSGYYNERFLKVRMRTLEEPVVIADKSILYFVRRPSDRKPVILGFENFPDSVFENEEKNFKVLIKDDDSVGSNKETYPPRLRLINTVEADSNALPFMRVNRPDDPEQDKTDPTIWKFTVAINTKEIKNFFTRNKFMNISYVAVSQFGVLSNPEKNRFQVINRVAQGKLSWPGTYNEVVKMEKGKLNTFSFTVFDPLAEGKVTADLSDSCNGLPGKIKCECQFLNYSDGSYCIIDWDIPADTLLKVVPFKIEITNKNSEDGTDKKVNYQHRNIELKEAPKPPAPPEPPPTPPVPPGPTQPSNNPFTKSIESRI